MGSKPVILVDQDGPLAQFEARFEALWRQRHPTHPFVEWDARRTWAIEEEYDEIYHNDIFTIMDEPGFFTELPIVPGAAVGINHLDAMFPGQVFICTSPMKSNPTCASDKMGWIGHHLGQKWLKKTIITADKTVVNGDYLIDDKYNITGLMEPAWEHILFTTPINAHHTDRRRVDSWMQIIDLFARETA
jgi:5'-nucleotidase